MMPCASLLLFRLMSWGKAIPIVFVAFAGFIGTMVYRMCRQRVDLVRDDYYQTELTYQRQLDRVRNAAQLTAPLHMTYREDQQQVAFALPSTLRQGEITFYRPADRQADVRVLIGPSHPARQVVPTQALARGYWRVKMSWSDGQREYYTETDLFL